MIAELSKLKLEVKIKQDLINGYHSLKDYKEMDRVVKEWVKAVRNYNKALSYIEQVL